LYTHREAKRPLGTLKTLREAKRPLGTLKTDNEAHIGLSGS